MKSKMKRKFTLRTGLLTALTVALIASAAVFIGASAAESVSPTDVVSASNTVPKHSVSHSVKQSGVSPSDVSASDVQASIIVTREAEPDVKNEPNLGAPAITMTTTIDVGTSLSSMPEGEFSVDGSPDIYIDYGDGTPVEYPGDGIVKGSTIKIFGDVSELVCRDCGLTSLDVSKCVGLTSLRCSINQISVLDVSQNSSLTVLECDDCQLESLDVSHNAALTNLSTDDNPLTSLDVSKNTELTVLLCQFDKLTSLNVKNNTKLETLACDVNQITALDLTSNTALTVLACGDNLISSLDVSHNTLLWYLDVSSCNLSEIDVSNNTKLAQFECGNNKLRTLDLSHNTDIKILICTENQLSSLEVSNLVNFSVLHCDDNQLTVLKLPPNVAWNHFSCKNNKLSFSDLDIAESNLDPEWDWDFRFSPQSAISIPASINQGESIDLSSENSVRGTKSVYTWYDSDDNVITPTKSNNGVFTFGEEFAGKKLHCKITNALYTEHYHDPVENYDPVENNEFILSEYASYLTTTEVTIKEADPVSEPETVSDSDIPVNNNSFVDSAEYSNDIKVTVNGVEIDIKNVQLIVSDIETNKKISILDAIQKYAKSINITMRNTALCDISLVDNNKVHVKVEKGKIKICLKYPDNLARQSEKYTFRLYHQKDDGTIEEIPVVCKPDGIYFEATSFSPFALVWNEKSSTGSPGTGESSVVIWNMFILLMLSAAAGAIVIYRNRFAEAE